MSNNFVSNTENRKNRKKKNSKNSITYIGINKTMLVTQHNTLPNIPSKAGLIRPYLEYSLECAAK
jgi:hypothetical protein